MKYLHCLKDEKFLDGAISLFEEDKRVVNTYVLFIRDAKNYSFRFIKNSLAQKQEIDTFLLSLKDFDVVILHSLTSIPIELIPQIPNKIKVVWLMWGFDFYNKEILNKDLYYPFTKRTLKLRHRSSLLKWISTKFINKQLYKKALNRIDYFSGVFPYEFDLFKHLDRYPNLKAKPLDFYYGSTSFFVPEIPQTSICNSHSNVIIGNSADPANNTLDVFELLMNTLDTQTIDSIIVPLSYGRNKDFIQCVKIKGIKLWGEKFKALDGFLPLEDYLKLISNCKCAIFFHERQQASDNVLMQLLYGARVFMSESSLMYQYLKKQGYQIYSLQKDIHLINNPLSDKEVMQNRILLSNNYSSSKLIERIRIINDTIKG